MRRFGYNFTYLNRFLSKSSSVEKWYVNNLNNQWIPDDEKFKTIEYSLFNKEFKTSVETLVPIYAIGSNDGEEISCVE